MPPSSILRAVSKPAKGSTTTALAGMIDHAACEHGAQNAMHVLVEFGRTGILPASTAALNLSPNKNLPGCSLSRPAAEAFSVRVRAAPVGDNEPGELPILLEHIGEQLFVFAGEVAVDAVIGAHDRGGVALGNADFERQQIALARRALADGDVDGVAAALLVVERVVLDVADDVAATACPRSAAPPGFRRGSGLRPGTRRCGRCAARG